MKKTNVPACQICSQPFEEHQIVAYVSETDTVICQTCANDLKQIMVDLQIVEMKEEARVYETGAE